MTDHLYQLYLTASDEANHDPRYAREHKACKEAILTVNNELKRICGEDEQDLLEVLFSLEARRSEAHERAVFRRGLELGLSLGRLS